MRVFLDTNIVVYLYTSTEEEKRLRAAKILLENEPVSSTQVLNELSNVLSKKYSFTWKEISKVHAEVCNQMRIEIVTPDIISKAYDFAGRYHFSFYDSLIVASALEANCELLYSEDFQHLQMISNSLRILNPFV